MFPLKPGLALYGVIGATQRYPGSPLLGTEEDAKAWTRRSGGRAVRLYPVHVHNFSGVVLSSQSAREAEEAAMFAAVTGADQPLVVSTTRGEQVRAVVTPAGMLVAKGGR